ncbi:copper homeostasis protein CutC [Martelella soudanensis]|uniref:copper homeostasis protein CutC n=1 Tax=unclassified Martelella TaxID=2629616 RepID=UPI0015DD7574|nr:MULTISPECIES: copper homeostasis protein CutC [unclassified Martelella]
MTTLLEICVGDVGGLETAVEAGADRIELCASLDQGGLTPSAGLIEVAAAAPVPVHVLIRPRAGGFVYTAREFETMLRDIAFCRRAGVAGVVIGALDRHHDLDADGLATLVGAARGMDITLHRAFDLTRDPFAALETAVALGIPRILTSGQEQRASEGRDLIAVLAEAAGERISLMPGGGLNAENAQLFLAIPGVRELHASCKTRYQAEALKLQGFDSAAPGRTDATAIRAMKAAMV